MSLPSIKWEKNFSVAPDNDFWTQICKNISFMKKTPTYKPLSIKLSIALITQDKKCSKNGIYIRDQSILHMKHT